MIGFDEDELLGAGPPFPYWPPEQLAECERNLAMTLAGQAPRSGFEMRIQRKNGERFDARFYLSPLIDLTGRQTGWMASITDITEPKRVRAALESAHERFEAVLDGLDAAVFVADARTDEILFANLAFKRIHGFDAVGRTVRGVAVPQPERGDYRVDPRNLSPADVPRELFDGELQHPLSGRWYHVREQATRWVDGRVVRMGIATDITDRKQTAEVAREQEERLQRTSRLITMGEMASTLAHELNQPLAAIANYCAGSVTRLQSGKAKDRGRARRDAEGELPGRARRQDHPPCARVREEERAAAQRGGAHRGAGGRDRLRRHRRPPHRHPHPHRARARPAAGVRRPHHDRAGAAQPHPQRPRRHGRHPARGARADGAGAHRSGPPRSRWR